MAPNIPMPAPITGKVQLTRIRSSPDGEGARTGSRVKKARPVLSSVLRPLRETSFAIFHPPLAPRCSERLARTGCRVRHSTPHVCGLAEILAFPNSSLANKSDRANTGLLGQFLPDVGVPHTRSCGSILSDGQDVVALGTPDAFTLPAGSPLPIWGGFRPEWGRSPDGDGGVAPIGGASSGPFCGDQDGKGSLPSQLILALLYDALSRGQPFYG